MKRSVNIKKLNAQNTTQCPLQFCNCNPDQARCCYEGGKKDDTIPFSRPITKVTHPNSPLGTGVHWTGVTASHSVAFVALGYHYLHTPTIQTSTSPSNKFFQYLFIHY